MTWNADITNRSNKRIVVDVAGGIFVQGLDECLEGAGIEKSLHRLLENVFGSDEESQGETRKRLLKVYSETHGRTFQDQSAETTA